MNIHGGTGRNLKLTRVIAAPPAIVFKAWHQRFRDWWGPHGMTTPRCELDLRPGGVFQAVMRAPDGSEYPARGVFLEVVPDARIVFTDAYDPEWQPRPDMFFTAVTTFDPAPGGRTILTAEARHWSEAACRRHGAMGFVHGWGESLDRLAGLVDGLQAG
jgi:uncharacterized protein YndB with AHSA1/START domain